MRIRVLESCSYFCWSKGQSWWLSANRNFHPVSIYFWFGKCSILPLVGCSFCIYCSSPSSSNVWIPIWNNLSSHISLHVVVILDSECWKHITWDYRHLIHFWGLFHTRHGPTCHAVSARSTCVQLWRELVISSTAEREAAKHLEDSWFGLRPVECYHNFLSDQLLCMFFCWWNLWPKIESMRLADCCQLKHVLLLGAERIPKIPFDSDC